MNYIEGYPVLSTIREKELIIKAQNGDKEATDIIILSNVGLAFKTAAKYTNNGLDIDDLFQTAIMGVMKAIPKFNTNENYKFSTYAMFWITQNLIRNIQNQSRVIRVPVHIFQKNFEIIALQRELEQELERMSTPEELAEYTGKSKKDIDIFIKSMRMVNSLDTRLSSEVSRTTTKVETISYVDDFNKFDEINSKLTINNMLKSIKSILKDEEYEIFLQHGIKNRTYTEVAESLDISRAKVQQHYRKIIEKLQRNNKIKMFRVS